MKASSLGGPKPQFVDANGNPYSGAKLFWYAAGSSTKQNTYRDSTGATPNTNPIVLDSSGRPTYEIWFTDGLTYKAVLAPSTDSDPPNSPIFTVDNLPGINDVTASVDEWQASGLTPTYVGATSFTVSGDQTATFTAGRRLKSANTAGTIYSTVTSSSYSGGTLLTTVTVVNDSGTLDSGLSSVSTSILRSSASSLPYMRFPAANTVAIIVGGTERVRVNSSGYFNASTTGAYASSNAHSFLTALDNWAIYAQNTQATTPYGIAVIYSAAAPNGAGSQFIKCDDNAATRFSVASNGGVYNYSANNVNLSDRREKTDFEPAKNYLDTLCQIPVQTFKYLGQSDDEKTLGVVAQDVEAVAPELVHEADWGTEGHPKMRLAIYQTDFQYALLKALQELKAEFDAYKATHP